MRRGGVLVEGKGWNHAAENVEVIKCGSLVEEVVVSPNCSLLCCCYNSSSPFLTIFSSYIYDCVCKGGSFYTITTTTTVVDNDNPCDNKYC